MADHAHLFPISKMSQVFGVSRSGYYRWLSAPPSPRAQENARLTRRIKDIWEGSGKTYGAPRIHQQLAGEGEQASRPRVARLMARAGIQSQLRPKWTSTTDSEHSLPVAPNVLNRQFFPDRLGQAWVSDITFIPSAGGWLYLTAVMDLADRQVLGWALSEGLKAGQTSIPAFQAACHRRPPGQGLLFHSDRGVQYACSEFRKRLRAYPTLTQSMSRKGNCWDNAPAESFFKTLKAELNTDAFIHYRQARAAIFEFIEIWYNRRRMHSALDYQTPAQAEQLLTLKQAI